MKTLVGCAVALTIAGLSAPADAKGCIKGAVVGGIAGHAVHHGVVGAVTGCLVGRHMAKKHEQESPAPADSGQNLQAVPAGNTPQQ